MRQWRLVLSRFALLPACRLMPKRKRADAATAEADATAREAEALARLEQDPLSASVPAGTDGMLPLHTACRKRGSCNLISALLVAYGEACSTPDAKGRLPLHWAAERGADRQIVDRLLAAHPTAAADMDAEGLLPLHLAAAAKAPRDTIAALLDAHPEGARTTDASFYRLPLHFAAVRKANLDCISLLLGAYPEAAGRMDGEGDTPAALAKAHAIGDEAIEILSSAAASAAIPPPPRHFNSTLQAYNVWEVPLPAAPLAAANDIYERCELRARFKHLQRGTARHVRLTPPTGAHETFFAVRAGAASAGGHLGWSSDVTWLSVDDTATFDVFRRIFEQCELAKTFRSICQCEADPRLYSASFVMRSRCEEPNMHVDYLEGVGARALTLMTPLRAFPRARSIGGAGNGGGEFQLVYEEARPAADGGGAAAAAPAPSVPAPFRVRRYEYQLGKAVIFGGGFKHSTEPGHAADDEPHCYLCFTFGTDRLEHWPLIAQTIDGDQSRMLCRPDGKMVLTQFGRRLQVEKAGGVCDV